MNDTTWLTAADAAKILRVSVRQVHRYAENKQLVTRRAGRRVLFSAASVAQLADDLAVDVRPPAPQQSRELMPPELVRHLTEQAELTRQQNETGQRTERRVESIEQRLRWLPLVLGVIVALLLAVLLILIWRGL